MMSPPLLDEFPSKIFVNLGCWKTFPLFIEGNHSYLKYSGQYKYSVAFFLSVANFNSNGTSENAFKSNLKSVDDLKWPSFELYLAADDWQENEERECEWC